MNRVHAAVTSRSGLSRPLRWRNVLTLDNEVSADFLVYGHREIRVADPERIRKLLDSNMSTSIEAMEEAVAASASDDSSGPFHPYTARRFA
jgi:hypothetical protein